MAKSARAKLSKTFPIAPDVLPERMARLVTELARLWCEEEARPRPDPAVLKHWDKLILQWAQESTLPLFIRKNSNNRGSFVRHSTGRVLVPTDNSPAKWAFVAAVLGKTPSLNDVQEMLRTDQIPVALALKTVEKPTAQLKCTLNKTVSPNEAGWKVAHVNGVAIEGRGDLAGIDERLLQEHFCRFMTPRNMFAVPIKYAGLGELQEFCSTIGKFN